MAGNAVPGIATRFITDTTNPPPPRHRWLKWGRWDLVEIADVITALSCWLGSNAWLMSMAGRHHHEYGGWSVLTLIALVTSAPLMLRTRFPLTAWVASGLAIIGASVVFPLPSVVGAAYVPTSLAVYFLCLYAVTVRCHQKIVVGAALATLVGALSIEHKTAVAAVFLAAIPLLLGTLVRMRRSSQRQLVEQERRHSGERALLEERQRIARELHDVVAHHMSVIAIQAEAAPYKAADPPEELVECFGEIRASALTGLTELRRLLGVLRTGGPSTTPQPGLANLNALIDSARGGGLSVTATVSGEPEPLPEGADLSAYRILQEALSNAMRHAPGSQVTVRLSYGTGNLTLDVSNDASPFPANGAATPGGGGHGIIGMRERAAMLGGTLSAGPAAGGGFRVTAVLPVSHDSDEDAT